ncbi:Kunitz/Bovine pancreatic trypsin inhibitor domain protein [Ancylostoma duodenale]|uniref:Kunitz/Bovine pancreatic trypsin inhibitor domain protein n=1 Tax=Ancylostoma duodenale TaxID=51022 RepID=A0A0C2GBE3_9BILA|nr:Kunitz/Bovine pancreatic trypsin inhibitor domain protein [Ancylostoma duodenale]
MHTPVPGNGEMCLKGLELSMGWIQCQPFWYDGCKGRSRNIFSDQETCEQMCEATNVLTRAGT